MRCETETGARVNKSCRENAPLVKRSFTYKLDVFCPANDKSQRLCSTLQTLRRLWTGTFPPRLGRDVAEREADQKAKRIISELALLHLNTRVLNSVTLPDH